MWRIHDVGKVFKLQDDEYDYRLLESSTLSEEGSDVSMFTLSELEEAANELKKECGSKETDFGTVYKGRLKRTNQAVVIILHQLRCVDEEGNREFLAQVSTLSRLDHPNLTTLIGYCVDQRLKLLVYEDLPFGSQQLKDSLHDLGPDKKPLDWLTRMKIAAGVAKGLQFLHDTANPPVLCTYLNTSSILLDQHYHPKICGFGFPTRSSEFGMIMKNIGCIEIDYFKTGHFTTETDVYSFGVVLLEIITGRKVVEPQLIHSVNLRNFMQMADPMLQGQYPVSDLHQVLVFAALCLSEEQNSRPRIAEVVAGMTCLVSSAELELKYHFKGLPSGLDLIKNSKRKRRFDDLY